MDARLEVRFYDRDSFIKQYTENISHGGLFVATDKPYMPGDKIKVDLIIPDLAASWPIEGEVVYQLDEERARKLETMQGIGIRITQISPGAESAFRAYVHKIISEYR